MSEHTIPLKPGFLEDRLRTLFYAVFGYADNLDAFEFTKHHRWPAYANALKDCHTLIHGVLIYRDPTTTPSWDVRYHFKETDFRPIPPSTATFAKYMRLPSQ